MLKVLGDYSELPDRLGVDIQILDQLSADVSAHYRRFNIAKKSGGTRKISAPSPALLRVQRKILTGILNKIPPHKAAKAYRSGYSIVRNARFHIGQPVLVKVDIKDFFGSIKSATVERIFQEAGFKRHERAMLTALCCLNGALPQGAATSGYLSNLAMSAFDKKMMIICRQKKLRYTRYADDICISGKIDDPRALLWQIAKNLEVNGLVLRRDKTVIARGDHQRQLVTGIVVNEQLSPGRNYLREIRKELHYACRFGLSSHAARTGYDSKFECLQILRGKVGFARQVMGDTDQVLSWQNQLASLQLQLDGGDLI